MPHASLLGVPVDVMSFDEAVASIVALMRDVKQHMIATPNPEMVVRACRDNQFRKTLSRASLCIADGIGVVWALKRKGIRAERITGVDVMTALCRRDDTGPVFLLGACEGIAATAARALCDANPALHVCGTFAGSPATIDEEHILEKIRAASPRMLFVAFGAPNQELWIARNLAKMPSVKVAMGVGGAFDFIAGKQKRAPQIFRSLGLEWLYRLMREPRRIVRIINAVVVFPFLVITRDR